VSCIFYDHFVNDISSCRNKYTVCIAPSLQTVPETSADLVRFQVLTAANMKMTVFWHVAPCSLVGIHRRFRGAYCIHHHGDESWWWCVLQRKVVIKIVRSKRKFKWVDNFSYRPNSPISNLIKIGLSDIDLFQTYGQTDGLNCLIGAPQDCYRAEGKENCCFVTAVTTVVTVPWLEPPSSEVFIFLSVEISKAQKHTTKNEWQMLLVNTTNKIKIYLEGDVTTTSLQGAYVIVCVARLWSCRLGLAYHWFGIFHLYDFSFYNTIMEPAQEGISRDLIIFRN
jgi:hypothetical protein